MLFSAPAGDNLTWHQQFQLQPLEAQVQRRERSQKQIVQVPDGSGLWDALGHEVVGNGHFKMMLYNNKSPFRVIMQDFLDERF